STPLRCLPLLHRMLLVRWTAPPPALETHALDLCRLAQPKSDVDDSGLALDAKRQSALLEHFQHRHVIRQDLSDQFLESGFPGNRGEMMHEGRAETLPLILIDHGESDLGLSRLYDNVTCAARDHWRALFVDDCDQRDVIDEVDAHEIVDFRLCEATFYRKETTVKGLRAAAGDGGDEAGPVLRSKRTDFDLASIAQRLACRIVGRFQHDRQLFAKPSSNGFELNNNDQQHVLPLRPSADGGAGQTTFGIV